MSCAVKPAIAPPPAVTVNGVEIPRDAIARETQNHPAATPYEAWKSAAQALAVREILLQEAKRQDLACEPLTDEEGRRETGEEAMIRALIEREIPSPQADDETCRRYFANNTRRFRSPDLYEASHILVATRQQALDIIAAIKSGPASFKELAKLHSLCPSGQLGGNLGQIGPGQTVPEFERALPAMPVGAVHETPIESRYGHHIVLLHHRETGQQLPYELARPRVAAYLVEHARRTAIRRYIGALVEAANIAGLELRELAPCL